MLTLNVGSNKNTPKDCINLDLEVYPGVNVVGDIRVLPFKDSTFDKIVCHHVLEHLYYPGVCDALAEFRRVLRSGGEVEITVPSMGYVSRGWEARSGQEKIYAAAMILGSGPVKGPHQAHLSLWDEELLAKFITQYNIGNMEVVQLYYKTGECAHHLVGVGRKR
jgi:ubiquinone/menaquinone biosynthesis C-methylase UbiE